jgi:cardiolipin synthase
MTWLNWPNRITIARILLIVPLIICLLNMNEPGYEFARRLALALFLLIGLADGLDGFLARRLRQVTAAGKFLDPLADKILIATMTIILAVDSTAVPGASLPNWVPVIAIGKDVLTVTGFALIYVAAGKLVIHPRPLGKACTVVQLAMIAVVLAAPDLPEMARGMPQFSWWAASVLAVLAAIDYLRWGNRAAAQLARRIPEDPRS